MPNDISRRSFLQATAVTAAAQVPRAAWLPVLNTGGLTGHQNRHQLRPE